MPPPATLDASSAATLASPGEPRSADQVPLLHAEFVALDVETNGRAGHDCELTEVGAVLVGGGELHERFESLVRPDAPLSRGVQHLTGISQAMVDGAPAPEEVLPRVARFVAGRVLVAHNASFDARALRQAFDRAGLEWEAPPALCTMTMARRFAPLVGRRGLVPLAEALGVEPEGAHRALVDAETCARVFCALFPKLCARASSVGEAVALLGPRRRRRAALDGRRRSKEERPDLSSLPEDPGVYVFRDERGRPLYVGKSVSVRSRARSHFCRPVGWTERAAVVDYRPTRSELGALVLENRLIKEWRPPGNVRGKRADGFVFLRARLDIAYPVLEVATEPAAGRAINVGPLRGREAAAELADELSSLFGLRHCGRRMSRREHPSLYGQMGRCLSPCLGDLDPNLYRHRLDDALRPFVGPSDGRRALLEELEDRMRAAAGERRYERAETLRRRLERVAGLLERLGGMLEAVHARSRLVLAPHPAKPCFDAFWIVAGRVAEWGPAGAPAAMSRRSAAVLERPAAAGLVPPTEVDEVRIVASWTAAHAPPELALEQSADPATLGAFLKQSGAARS